MSYEVRVPESLLLAPLPGWVKMVWVAIRSFQGRGDACYAKYEMIGERTIGESGKPTDKGQVSRAVSALIKAGFLKRLTGRSLRCVDPDKIDQESTLSTTPKVDQESTVVDQESTKVDQESTPSKNQHRKPKVKTKKERGSKVFSPDSWQYKISVYHFDQLKAHDKAPTSALKTETKTIQEGAAEFDKLRRIDKHDVEEIWRVIRWVFESGRCWMFNKGNYRTAKKLRSPDKNGIKWFENFQIESKTHANNGRSTGHNGQRSGRSLEDDFDAAFAEMRGHSQVG